MRTVPSVGFSRPLASWMSVLLPLPVCPAMPKNSPWRTENERSLSAQYSLGDRPQSACLPAGATDDLRRRS